jgi:site-specific recombinase XerD
MKDKKEIEKFVITQMKRLDYSEKSIGIYHTCISKLNDFYSSKDLESISFEEMQNYIKHMQSERLGVSASAINQAIHSFSLLYNKIWNNEYDFASIERPERKRSNPNILTSKEILLILDCTSNLKHKLLIALAYSAGLDKAEVRNLRLIDIDTHRDVIKIRDNRGKAKREAVLAKYVKGIYKTHLKQNKPNKLVFESGHTGEHYGETTIGKILANQAIKAGIKKKITFKTLKYSYVIHLQELGRPLLYTLEDLKMTSSQSLVFFSEIVNRSVKNKPFSPLDKIALRTDIEYPINVEYLEQAILGIPNKDEADYLREALVCMNSGSLRAGIIFAWTAAVINLRNKCFIHGKVTLNAALTKHNPKAKEVKKIEDFSYINDALLLLTCQELGEIDKGEKDSLEDCLDTRNKCGHPGKHKPKPIKAAAIMEELIQIVFK